ncbi:hypothetical protein ZHAS_00013658 [Anopheles sinensis]|uniref:Uncharacterized protein n=1 Tax=Anopheles sinensis TaxID=74873 RepID=A0A084W665_ANOSI|nr:hypothetical protein ZHAS_00013658 [Anopheles sinensis]
MVHLLASWSRAMGKRRRREPSETGGSTETATPTFRGKRRELPEKSLQSYLPSGESGVPGMITAQVFLSQGTHYDSTASSTPLLMKPRMSPWQSCSTNSQLTTQQREFPECHVA